MPFVEFSATDNAPVTVASGGAFTFSKPNESAAFTVSNLPTSMDT
ncbi:MAG: hypothetical protein R2715_00760 [Ilumatobacteraceae bacterium]